MSAPHIIYLHGFASGPSSRKAGYFRDQLVSRGATVEIPDLAEGDFEHLTVSGQMRVIERVAAERPVSLMGSSMGGYLAALYASRHPEVEKLVLLAPAFRFPQTWADTLGPERVAEWKKNGKLIFFHYAEQRERFLEYGMVTDGIGYPLEPDFRQPALIFHGTNDTVVPPAYSVEYAASHPNVRLRLMNSGHELTDVLEPIWREVSEFLFD